MSRVVTIITAVALTAGTLFSWTLYKRHKVQLEQQQQEMAEERQRTEAEHQRLEAEKQREQQQAEKRNAQLAEAQKEAEQQQAAFVAIRADVGRRYDAKMQVVQGRRYSMDQTAAFNWMQQVLNRIPKNELVDLISMYKALAGFDGSTTSEALAKCQRSYVGKYYVLQGDVFQIQADRDYPRDGENDFMLFGNVNLPPFIPVNVAATSAEKVPPYISAPMLTKIVGFNLGRNRRGETIVIPVVDVVLVVSGSSFRSDPSDVIISQPKVVAQLLNVQSQRPDPDQQPDRSDATNP